MKPYTVAALACLSFQATAAAVNQPEGWSVQYVDGSCLVHTSTPGASPAKPGWDIKMGFLAGNQLIFIFSGKTKGPASDFQFPAGTKAWLTVNQESIPALAIVHTNGELVVPTENSLALHKALSKAENIGARLQTPTQAAPIDAMGFTLFNIPGAVEWLDACNKIGVGALP